MKVANLYGYDTEKYNYIFDRYETFETTSVWLNSVKFYSYVLREIYLYTIKYFKFTTFSSIKKNG